MATRARFPLLFLTITAIAAPVLTATAHARPGEWGRSPGYGDPWGMERAPSRRTSSADPREGRVDVSRFVARDGAALLDPGPMRIVSLAGGTDDEATRAIYEAALVDQLVRAGYDTMAPAADDGRVIEMRIVRDVLTPAEGKKNPVSGTATVGVSNRGSMMGMAVNVDLSDPKKALLSTRLELHVRAAPNGPVLWEGHATLATRDEDENWGEADIANRLAAALFDGFPLSADTVDAPVR